MAVNADATLRPYTPADAPAVKALHAHAFATLAAGSHTAEQAAAHQALIADPAYDVDLARSHLTLAIAADGAIVATAGWIEVPEAADTARIRKVFVHPLMARRGLATRLVRHAEREAAAAGRPRLIVRANLNAVPLYESLGYRGVRAATMLAAGVELPVRFMEKMEKAAEPA